MHRFVHVSDQSLYLFSLDLLTGQRACLGSQNGFPCSNNF
jgi:hypothetical protein